ncbi:hypothetical protein NQ314_013405 [Rhamnusium bicolor]|uniref:Uncharacterized protein n=1 Tax=Rhamnusium bicolor TaxID=1586634 RepID=A0AAV8X8R0_9CUCU|nr:hypothetical protein NQ314_013405 [Rhamnusium bicolor]
MTVWIKIDSNVQQIRPSQNIDNIDKEDGKSRNDSMESSKHNNEKDRSVTENLSLQEIDGIHDIKIESHCDIFF